MIEIVMNSPLIVLIFFAFIFFFSFTFFFILFFFHKDFDTISNASRTCSDGALLSGFGGTVSSLYFYASSSTVGTSISDGLAIALITTIYGVVVFIVIDVSSFLYTKIFPIIGVNE